MPDASDPSEDVIEIVSWEGVGKGRHGREITMNLLSYWKKKGGVLQNK